MFICFTQVQKKGKEVGKAQKQLQMDLAAIEAVCIYNYSVVLLRMQLISIQQFGFMSANELEIFVLL